MHDPFLLQGCRPRSSRAALGGRASSAVERRGKWVVIALAEHRGLIVIQPRMTGGFWLVPPGRPDHVAPDVPPGGPEETVWYCDNRRLGKIAWYPDLPRPRRPSRGRTGPTRWRSAATSWPRGWRDRPGDQADVDGSEGAGRDRQHLRRRDPLPGPGPPRAARLGALAGRGRPHSRGDRTVLDEAIAAEGSSFDARLPDGARPRRGLPRARTPCTAAAASLARRAAPPSRRPRSPA